MRLLFPGMFIVCMFQIVGVSWAQIELPADNQAVAIPQEPAAAMTDDLSKYTYSYGSVSKVTGSQVILQEYDYDSDVEKEVTYQVDPDSRLEGIKSVTELVAEDVVEVYYLEQDGQKVIKILRKEPSEDENTSNNNTETDQ